MTMRWCRLVSLFLVLVLVRPGAADGLTIEEWATARLDSILLDYSETRDLAELGRRSAGVMEAIAGWSLDPSQSKALGRAYAMEMHGTQLAILSQGAGAARYKDLAAWLLGVEQPAPQTGRVARRRQSGWEVAEAIAALRRPEADPASEVYKLIADLWEQRGDKLADYPELVAAIAVVFDRGLPVNHIEQEIAHPVDALAVFDHLTEGAGSMVIKPDRLPGDLMVYVVDAAVSAQDLEWGLRRCSGHTQIGLEFHEVTYDTRAIQRDGKLRLETSNDKAEFGLDKILRLGGVCRHQAFFASSLGKSVSVPTVYVTAYGPQMRHAWVGYLRGTKRNAYWDMSEGRYFEYQKVRGEITCPQTRRIISDQQVGMSANLWKIPLSERLAAAAMVNAASRIDAHQHGRARGYPGPRPDLSVSDEDEQKRRPRRRVPPQLLDAPRPADIETRLTLLRAAVESVPWSTRGWDTLHAWGDELTDEQRREWFDVIYKQLGKKFPDVMVTTVVPILERMDDPAQRDAGWEWLAERVRRVPQLSLEVAVKRANGLAEAGETDAALAMYSSAAQQYATEGAFVLDAIDAAARLLYSAPNQEAANGYLIGLYEGVFRRTRPPPQNLDSAYRNQSVHIRVGRNYARLLTVLGRPDEAAAVRRRIR